MLNAAWIVLPAIAVLSACMTAVMIRVGTLDHPVARSSHTRPTPKGGGVAIAAATLAGALSGCADWVLLGSALALAAISYVDDVRSLPFWVKMAAQCGASGAVIAGGGAAHGVAIPDWGTLPLGLAGPVLSFLWLIFVTNAVNFMDGLNGLAAGCAAIACLGIVLASGTASAWQEAVLIAALVGFLPFNYPVARLFMGDVGSQFLGFLLAGLALRHAVDARLSLILPAALLPILLDVLVTLFLRWRRGESLTEAHRSHTYQRAHQAGIPAWWVTLVYWLLTALGAACGSAAGYRLRPAPAALVPIVVACVAWFVFVQNRTRMRNLPTC